MSAGSAQPVQQRAMFGAIGIAVVALAWLGMVLGVSFVATTAKFMAPTLSLPIALDVGRHTFRAFVHIELVLYAAIVILTLGFARRHLTCVIAIILGCIVASEFVWVLPALDSRVGIILAGGVPRPSHLHQIYITLESVKALALFVLGVWAVLALAATGTDK